MDANGMQHERVDLLVVGIGELATPLGSEALAGIQLGEVRTQECAAVACAKGRIVAVGSDDELQRQYLSLIHISEPTRPY